MKSFAIAALALVAFAIRAQSIDQPRLRIGEHTFFVELARTPDEWGRGLMFRDSLSKNHGMLFVSDREQPRSFWMKNTKISLDILFISANRRIVHIAEHTKPFSEDSIESKGLAKYILEINAGLSKQYRFKKGDKVEFFSIKD